jgi:hypothetical protein
MSGVKECDMHVTWWVVALGVLLLWTAVSECRSSPRQARRLRDVLKGGAGSHAEAFGKQRRSYQRKMWWQLPGGVALLLLGMIIGFRGDWGGAVYVIEVAMWFLISGIVGFVCLRILGPPAQTMDS